MKKIIITAYILFISFEIFAQGHFIPAYENSGQEHMSINVLSALIDNQNLASGDEIAIFDGSICCGTITLTGPIIFGTPSTYVTIAASKSEVDSLNGYTEGNPIIYKFWKSTTRREYATITAQYFDEISNLETTAPVFKMYASAFVKLSYTTPVNHVPISNAGFDQSINEGVTVTLDGTASSDSDGDALTYQWTAPAGITLSSITASKPTFTAPEVAANTNYTFSLVVNDGKANSTADQIVVTVNQVNKVPVANAGTDQSVNEGITVTLDGTASTDGDGDALTYLWTAPAGITLSSTTISKPTFTAPEVAANTNYTFSLVVNDGKVGSTADQIVVTVKQVNKVPVANAGTDQSVNEGVTVTIDGTASSDGDGDALTYAWTAPAGITLSSATASKPTFVAPEVATNTNYTFSLVVNDGKASSTADQIVLTVKQVNKVPVANAGPDLSAIEGITVTLDGTGSSDADSDALTYLWTAPAGITLSSATASKPTFTSPQVSVNTSYTFSLIVNDGKASSAADQIVITVKQVNKVPVANAGPDQSVNEGLIVTLDGTGSSDPDADALTYLWTAPAGITLSSATASKPTFTAPEVATNTNYTFSLIVTDGIASSTADQVIVTVNQVNKVPVANAGIDQSVNEGLTVTLDGTGSSDADSDALTYLWTAPAGITLSSTTASKPNFTSPQVSVNTSYTFSLIVNDGKASSTTDQIVVTVKQVNKVPVANAGPDQSVNEGLIVTLDGTGSSDGDGDALTYLWTAPAGITLSFATATKPTFTAPEVAINTNYTFSLVVNDGIASSTADQVIVTVKQVNKVPVANAGTDQSVNEGVTVTLDGTASSDGDSDILTYFWTAPAGITLSSNTVSKPTFTAPEVAANTNYTISLVVNDGKASSTADQIVVTVKQVNKAPVANSGPDQSVNEGLTVTLDGTGSSDPDADVLTYLWTAPAGITLSSATAAKPTFTAPEVAANTNYTFSLIVNDGKINSTADQIVVAVKQVNKVPVANAGIDQSVNEGTMVLLDGTGSSDGDGDILTYLWTAPAGITLSSNTVSKPTFTAPEVNSNTNYIFSLTVNDGKANSDLDQITVVVKQVNKTPVANAGIDQSINEGITVTLDGSASSDPDGDALTYQWTAPSGVTLSSNSASKPTFTAPEVSADTDYSFSLVVNDGKINSSTDQVVVKVKQVNKIPVANAGIDFTGTEGKTIQLDGSLSSDGDNDPLSYTWTAPAGITINLANTVHPTFVAPLVTSSTNYTFSLVVNDGKSNSSIDQVIVTIIPNRAPVANAGPDLFVKEMSLFTLDGSGSSDLDGDALTYKWTAPNGILLTSLTEMNPSFITPKVTETTSLVFSLVVNDGKKDSQADEVVLTLKSGNTAPVANAGVDQTVNEGETVYLNGTNSFDPDGDALIYLWTATSNIIFNSETSSKPSFVAPEVMSDTPFIINLKVNDGTIFSTVDQVAINVKQVNKPPLANAGPIQSINEGSLVTLDGTGSSDPDNDKLTYTWTAPNGITLSSINGSKPTFTAPEVSTNKSYDFILVVNDGKLNSVASHVIVTVKQVNKAPVADAGPDQQVFEGSLVSLTGTSSYDPDNDGIKFYWTAPPGITLSADSNINPSFIAPEVSENTTYIFSLVVNDGLLNSTVDQVNILVKQQNKAPVANAGSNQSVDEGALVTLDGSASSDPDKDNITYKWSAPPGIILSSLTAPKPTFTAPSAIANTDYVFSLIVNDGQANSISGKVIITIKHKNRIPVANAGTDQTVKEAITVTLDGSTSFDPDNSAITFTWTAPQGIILSSVNDPMPTFVAPEVSTTTNYIFSLVVNDGSANSVADNVTITVNQVNQPPVYNSSKIFSVNQGQNFELILSGTDPDNDPINFSISNLPSFISLNKKTETSAVLSGNASSKDIGSYLLALKLSDGALNSNEIITVIITQNDQPPYVVNPISDISVFRNSPVQRFDLSTVFKDDNPGDILQFSVLSNSNNQVVSATISSNELTLIFSANQAGNAEIVISAISNGKQATLKINVEVKNLTEAQSIASEPEIQLYPNPTSGTIKLNFRKSPKSGTKIFVFDLTGKLLLRKDANNEIEELDLNTFRPGTYLIRIGDQTQKTYTVVKK